MIKTRTIKVKSIRNEEIIITITLAKIIVRAVIMKIIIIMMMTIRMKIRYDKKI